MILASAGRFSEYWSIIAVESIAATGLTIPLPDMSGAEPVIVHEWINTLYLCLRPLTMYRLIYTVNLALPVWDTAQTRARQ